MKLNLLLVSILSVFLFSCSQTKAPNKHKTIMLHTYGKVETLPDMASFTLNLSCLKKSVKASKNCLVEKSNELTQTLLSHGIAEEDILTTSISMNKSYKWNRNTQVFEGYNSSTRMHVTIRNLDKLADIYTELLEKRELHIGGLQYNHSKIDSLQNEAYAVALRNASELADKLLAEIPESKKEIIQVGNVELSASMPQDNNNYEADYKSFGEFSNKSEVRKSLVSINTGTVTVYADIHVEYQIR